MRSLTANKDDRVFPDGDFLNGSPDACLLEELASAFNLCEG